MIIIWIIAIFLAIAGFIFLRFEHHLKLVRIGLIFLVLLLIYMSMNSVLSSETVDITSPSGVVNAIYVYVGWLGETTAELFDIGKDTAVTVGNAIKVDGSEPADLPHQETGFNLVDWITDKIRKD